MSQAGDERLPRRVLLWVALVASSVRLLYLTEHLESAFFGVPILDEAFYDAVARALLAGEAVTGVDPGFRPLLYPAFLALAYAVGGAADAVVAVGFQHLMGVGTAFLAAAIAWRLSRSRAAALIAGLAYGLAGPPLFFEGERLATTLFTFLVAAVLWWILRAEAGRRWIDWSLAGGVAALAVQVRPNALVFLPLFVLVGLFRALRGSGGARGPLLAAPSGFLVILVAAAAIQAPFLGGFHLAGGSGGVNFYLGNERGADGMTPVQDRGVVTGDAYRDSVEVFAREEATAALQTGGGASPSPSEVSRYWVRRGLAEIAADPWSWGRLMTRKVRLLLWNEEIPNNKSYRFVLAEESRVLDWMPVRWWVLLALASPCLAGVRRAGSRSRVWLPAFLAVYGGSLLLFFVNSRFRIPLWPALAALAGIGALELVVAFRRGPRAWGPRVLAVALVAGISLGAGAGVILPGPARDHLFRSMAARQKGWDELALRDARRAVELSPGDPDAWIHLGVVEQDRGAFEAALGAYRRAAVLAPGEPRPPNNVGVILEERGRPVEAYEMYREALARLPDYGPALVNAALLELRAGRIDLAESRLRTADEVGYRSPSARVATALAARSRGHEEEARKGLAEVAAAHPDLVRRLLEEHEVRLDLGGPALE